MKWIVSSGIAIAAIASGVWGYNWYSASAQMAKVDGLQKQLFSPEARELPQEKRRAMWAELKSEGEKLTEDQKQTLFRNAQRGFEERIDKYFALSETDRTAYLDTMIDEWESKRKQSKKQKSKKESGAAKPSGTGTFAGGGGGPPGAGGGGPGGGGPRGFGDPGQREQWRRQMLDRTSPEQRAKMSEFFSKMMERRKQRGL